MDTEKLIGKLLFLTRDGFEATVRVLDRGVSDEVILIEVIDARRDDNNVAAAIWEENSLYGEVAVVNDHLVISILQDEENYIFTMTPMVTEPDWFSVEARMVALKSDLWAEAIRLSGLDPDAVTSTAGVELSDGGELLMTFANALEPLARLAELYRNTRRR